MASRHLDQTFLKNPLRPSDQLLRWHFRQAVLVSVKGLDGRYLEHDFPCGSDIMTKIMNGPRVQKRMEFELLSCFNAMGPGI